MVFAYSAGNFLFGHLWLLTLAEEGRQKDCFIFLQIVPVFPWHWAMGGLGRQVVLLCVPARGTGPPTAPVAMGSLGVSGTVCLLRSFLKPSLNRGPNNLKQKDFWFWQFFQVLFNKFQCGKTQKEKLSGWFLLLVCIFIFFFSMVEITYLPYSMKASVVEKSNINAKEIVFCKTRSDG